MCTVLFALGRVEGAFWALAGWQFCLILFAVTYIAISANRGARQLGRAVFSFGALSAVFDFVWFIYYFPSAEYVDRGAGGWVAALLYPALLLVLLVALTLYNRKH